MSREQHMKDTLQAYIDAYNSDDLVALLALYSDDASVEDPYGTPPKKGKAEIMEFYRQAMANGATLQLSAPIRGSGADAAAMALDAVVKLPEGSMRVSVIDVMTFNDAGLIVSMRAYFGQSDIRMSTQD
ncbi:nuclear transport factor 2 family protein [Pseudomonas shirazensis]|uniref:nuclear transport factor 2 family protein n=1 Tax=Pseudomonas shirazensis TaxID=2745494 RepID=UPI0039864E29